MIKGDTVVIRTIAEQDLNTLLPYMQDLANLGEYLPMDFVSEAQFRKDYAEHGFIRPGAERFLLTTANDEILGCIWIIDSLTYFSALELGYHIFDTHQRGKGYASEAVRHLTDFVFRAREVNRVEIRMATTNIPSQKVAEKAGFIHEGIARGAAFSYGEYHDMHTYALTRQDWLHKT